MGVVVSTVRKPTEGAPADGADGDDDAADDNDDEPSSPRLHHSRPSPLMPGYLCRDADMQRRNQTLSLWAYLLGHLTKVSPCAEEMPKLSSKFSGSSRLGRWFPYDQARLKNFKQ